MKAGFLPLAVLLGIRSIGWAGDGAAPKNDVPAFKITTRRTDDTVAARSDRRRTVFDVKSSSGIGQAVVERADAEWPRVVVLRLHLTGLEGFWVSSGKVTVHAAVAAQDGKVSVYVQEDGKEEARVDRTGPLWLDIRLVGSDGKPARGIPLQDGYFEVVLPRAFFAGNPQSITLRWIDFYRS